MQHATTAILFDLDGTLVDSAPGLCHALNKVRQQENLSPLKVTKITPYISHGAQRIITQSSKQMLAKNNIELLEQQFHKHYQDTINIDVDLFPGIEKALNLLINRKIPWGIVTNKSEKFTNIMINNIPILQKAMTCICGDSLPQKKPEPHQLKLACKQLNTPENTCIYIGDSLNDMTASHSIAMPSWLAAYGYIAPNDDISTWPHQKIITTSNELINQFEQLLFSV